jgi:serine/threonine protein kinase
MITPSVGLVPRELIGFYFAQIVEAVLHVHGRGICHLDIKPENLFVDATGRVKLGDFGLATFAEDGPVVGCRGSLAYAAPENVRSSRRSQEVVGCRAPGQGYDGQKAGDSLLSPILSRLALLDAAKARSVKLVPCFKSCSSSNTLTRRLCKG